MPIRVDQFGGIMPRVDAERLAGGAAQRAHNVDLTSGALAPIAVAGPFVALHDGTKLNAGIPASELKSITKPAAPSALTFGRLCRLVEGGWLSIKARVWLIYEDPDNGYALTKVFREWTLPIGRVVHTFTGMRIHCSFPTTQSLPVLPARTPYELYGPLYQFIFTADNAGYGGPRESLNHPEDPNASDPALPGGAMPLFYDGKMYAQFAANSVRGPEWTDEFEGVTLPAAPELERSSVTFDIDLNYVNPLQRTYYFVQTMVQKIADTEYEGPASEVSNAITVGPGQLMRLATPLAGGYTRNKLYVAGSQGDRFLLQADVNGSTWTDNFEGPQGIELPAHGNYTESGANADTFREGSLIHPAQFGVAFTNNSEDAEYLLWFSDVYRLFAWPEEWTVPFTEEIKAIALTGNTVLVFSGEKVFAVGGSNPAAMQKYQLSESHPLLNKLGLGRIGNTVFWPTYDGLAASTGSDVQIVTRPHTTRTQWLEWTPAAMKAKSADNSLFLEGGASKLRVDLYEDVARISTYSALSGVDYAWKSGRMRTPRREIFDYLRVVADAAVDVRVWVDGTELADSPFTAPDGEPVALGSSVYGQTVELQAEGSARVQSLELFERVVLPGAQAMRFTPADTPIFESIWVKFPDRDRFVAGSLMVQSEAAVPIELSDRAGTVLYAGTIENGKAFALPRGAANNPLTDLVRVSVQAGLAKIDELLLYCRRREAVGKTLRIVPSGDGLAPWLYTAYEVADKGRLKSLIVNAQSNVTMLIYLNGAETPAATVNVTSGAEIRLTGFAQASMVEWRFESGGEAQDWLVDEVIMQVQTIVPIGDGGIELNGPDSWRGMLFKFPDRGTFACASLGAAVYNLITFKLYKDGSGAAATTKAVTNGNIWLLPRDMGEGALWEVDVASAEMIQNLIVRPRVRVPVGGRSLSVTAQDTGIMPWAWARYDFTEKTLIVSGQVIADAYPLTLRLFGEGAERSNTPTKTITVTDAREFRIEGLPRTGNLDFDFNGDDYKVNKVMLQGRDPIACEAQGIIIREGLAQGAWRARAVEFKETGSFSVARVVASDYTGMKLRLYANGVLAQTVDVSGNGDFKLSGDLPTAREWEFDLEHAGDVYELHLIGRTRWELKNAGVRVTREREPFSWLGQRVVLPRPMDLSCVRVQASRYPVRLLCYQAGRLSKTLTVRSERAVRLPRSRPAREWEFDAIAENGEGTEIEMVALGTAMSGLG